MNIKFLTFVAFIFFLSCSSKKESNVQTTQVTPAPANVETPQTSSGDDIKSLTSFVGKKPSEAQIFDKFDFTKRFFSLDCSYLMIIERESKKWMFSKYIFNNNNNIKRARI